MFCKSLITAAVLSLTTATGVLAAPLEFDFSFGDPGSFFEGTILGLENGLGVEASSIVVTAPSGPGGHSYTFGPSNITSNEFDVIGGEIVRADFQGGTATAPVSGFQLSSSDFSSFAQLFDGSTTVLTFFRTPGLLDFELVTTDVAAVLLPAGGFLLLSGFVGMAVARRRQKMSRIAERFEIHTETIRSKVVGILRLPEILPDPKGYFG